MPDLPSGTATFLFADIEGTTAVEARSGVLFKTVGDAIQTAFPTAFDTVVAATPHPRSGPLSWPYRACPRPGSFLVKRRSPGHPRGAHRRALAPHRSSA